MSPLEALAVLDRATDPRFFGQLTRSDYAAVQQALLVLQEVLSPRKDDSQPLSNLVPTLDKALKNGKGSKP